MKSYKFIIQGKVQKVYYRKTVCENAIKENFNGYVKNLPNGDVEACVTCSENELERFIEILQIGSVNSKVTNIIQSSIDDIFTNGFIVAY